MNDGDKTAKRRPGASLASRLILFVFSSAFVAALVVSAISVHATFADLRALIEQSFPDILSRSEERLAALVDSTAADLRELASQPALTGPLADPQALARGSGLLLQRVLAGSGRMDALLLVDLDAKVLASAYAPTLGGGGLEPMVAGLREPVAIVRNLLVVSVVVHSSDGQPLAILRGVVGSGVLVRELKTDRGAGSGHVYLVDRQGRVGAKAQEAWPFVSVPTSLIEKGTGGGVAEFQGADGTRALGLFRALPYLGGGLVVARPTQEAFAPVFSLVSRIFVADLVIAAVFSLLAFQITNAIVRPIEALSRGARRISEGELDVEVPERSGHDEVALLTRAFNGMARRLRRNQAELEQQHAKLREQNQALQEANEVLEQLSITDGLTKLHNHRYFQEALTREIKRVSRTKDPLSILLIDIDDFKALNDRHGHAAGDDMLKRIAQILNESVRESDILARYGGEEFVVLATGTNLEGSRALAEKIRMEVAEASILLRESRDFVRVTVSIGIAEYDGDRRAFFDAADRALYNAKGAGKDCVVAAEDRPPPSPSSAT